MDANGNMTDSYLQWDSDQRIQAKKEFPGEVNGDDFVFNLTINLTFLTSQPYTSVVMS